MDRFLLQERMVQEGLHLHLEGRETSKTGRPLLHPFTQLIGRSQMGLCIAEGFLGIKVGINPRLYVRDRLCPSLRSLNRELGRSVSGFPEFAPRRET